MYGEQQLDNVFVTADHHFGHDNIRNFCNRPFNTVEDMDEILIKKWNERVGTDGVVYHLGDFTLGRYAENYFKQLNGFIHIIPGGHDSRWMARDTYAKYTSASGESICICPPILEIGVKVFGVSRPLTIVMCHYAMRVWNKSHYGSMHLYGHSHGRLPGLGRSMDVGVDAHNFYPISLREVLDELQRIPKPNL